LGLEEVFQISLALKKLTQKHPLASVRFWGKIFGTRANYIVAECEYQEGEGEEEEEEPEEQAEEKEQPQEDEEEGEEEKDEPPKPTWRPPPVIPKEAAKSGANKKTYFVCNEAGEEWRKLPHVTPAQIVAAKEIRKLFTGKLDAPVNSFPPFPGNEENYLRAQIARISATCQISPSGYFAFDEEEEQEDEEEVRDSYIINPDYEGKAVSELADESLANWVHHTLYLLPQGRCTWFNPIQKAEDEFEDEEEDEEKEQLEEPEPETGPPLLTSIEQDAQVDGLPPWSVKLSSQTTPHYAVAFVSSNLWPGAHAFGTKKQFENVYIGWGLKYHANPFNPPLPPAMQEEFPAGVDINEVTDPTVEQEQALKRAQEEAEANMEEEEEAEDDEDDD
jgi:radial spoke head protein 4A